LQQSHALSLQHAQPLLLWVAVVKVEACAIVMAKTTTLRIDNTFDFISYSSEFVKAEIHFRKSP
jgi:hypothetical protein